MRDEGVQQGRPVLHPLEPAADQRAELVEGRRGEVAQAALEMRPHPLGKIELGRAHGQAEDGRPGQRSNQPAHQRIPVRTQVVPHQHNRPAQLPVGGIQQASVVDLHLRGPCRGTAP